jgi:hypothetical protein
MGLNVPMRREARWARWARWALAASVVLPAAASATGPAGNAAPAALRERIQALVGPAACSSDADCRSSALGTKACGGPEAYIAWSVRGTDEAALTAALSDYAAAQQAAIVRDGRMSNCAFVTDPGAVCVAPPGGASACQLRQRTGRPGQAGTR